MREHFLKLKSNLELAETFGKSIETRHNAIRTYLENNYPMFKDSKLIGSLQRNTRIHPGNNGKFDIDIIVVVGECYGWVPVGGLSPEQALGSLHQTVDNSDLYGAKNPVIDAPTVTLTYDDDIQIQLVPALVDMAGVDQWGNSLGSVGRGYWVVKDGTWKMADYDHEAEYIAAQNKLSEGYLVPTIKMLKAVKRVYFPELESFPLEIIAANIIPASVIIKRINGTAIHYRDLVLDFFEGAHLYLSSPIKVPNSKSAPMILDAATIAMLTEKFTKIANHIRATNAIEAQGKTVEAWRALFGEHFPVALPTV